MTIKIVLLVSFAIVEFVSLIIAFTHIHWSLGVFLICQLIRHFAAAQKYAIFEECLEANLNLWRTHREVHGLEEDSSEKIH